MLRNVSGSCRLRDPSGAQPALPSSRRRSVPRLDARPGCGRAASTAACSTDRFAPRPSRLSAPATSSASRRRPRSANASAAHAVENGLPVISARPSPAASSISANIAPDRSASGARSAWPTEPSDAHRRRFGEREDLDEPLGQERPDAGKAACERVQLEQERRPHDVGRGERALRDPVVTDHPLRVGVRVGPLEWHALEHADRRRDAIRGRTGGHNRLDDGTRPVHLLARGWVEAHGLAVASHAHQLVERQRSAGDEDAHGAASLRQGPRAMRLQQRGDARSSRRNAPTARAPLASRPCSASPRTQAR